MFYARGRPSRRGSAPSAEAPSEHAPCWMRTEGLTPNTSAVPHTSVTVSVQEDPETFRSSSHRNSPDGLTETKPSPPPGGGLSAVSSSNSKRDSQVHRTTTSVL
ncbi:hypothetical protein NFI96_004365 [Prochilodus magdalenae]|nr:hypothetical protein NFI96_004365 [Prochilodus magdalenae]